MKCKCGKKAVVALNGQWFCLACFDGGVKDVIVYLVVFARILYEIPLHFYENIRWNNVVGNYLFLILIQRKFHIVCNICHEYLFYEICANVPLYLNIYENNTFAKRFLPETVCHIHYNIFVFPYIYYNTKQTKMHHEIEKEV